MLIESSIQVIANENVVQYKTFYNTYYDVMYHKCGMNSSFPKFSCEIHFDLFKQNKFYCICQSMR